ncbi:MAG: alpha/beta fold hydrolase, partial [Desulfobacterales bacterium]|nr:alpha/beta fold hydrolase [Desulfobacterales bacterium]
ELGPDQPFYGLQPQGLDGRTEPLHSVQDMAARYVAEIRNVAPHGPYYLLGYSLGGAVAFEMAHQLEARGQRVAFLGLIDSGFPRAADAKSLPLLVRLRLHAKEIFRRTPTDAIRYVGRRINALRRRIALAADSRDSCERRVALAGEAAWRNYTPEPWAGRLTLFASTGPEDTIWEDFRPRWSTVVGGMDVVAVCGTHASIVSGADVVGLAAAIRTSLASARGLRESAADVE